MDMSQSAAAANDDFDLYAELQDFEPPPDVAAAQPYSDPGAAAAGMGAAMTAGMYHGMDVAGGAAPSWGYAEGYYGYDGQMMGADHSGGMAMAGLPSGPNQYAYTTQGGIPTTQLMGGGGGYAGAVSDLSAPVPGKLFVGGINFETSDAVVLEYFSKFGTVASAWVMRDRSTGASRGFGFVIFANPSTVSEVLRVQASANPHMLDGRVLVIKPATARDTPFAAAGGFGPDHQTQDMGKIFVGGLHLNTTEDDLRHRFSEFGVVVEVLMMMDKITGRPRGFGFVTFAEAASAVKAEEHEREIKFYGKPIEIKPAVPRGAAPPPIRPVGIRPPVPNSYQPRHQQPSASTADDANASMMAMNNSDPAAIREYFINMTKAMAGNVQVEEAMRRAGATTPETVLAWMVAYWKNCLLAMMQQQSVRSDSEQGKMTTAWIAMVEKTMAQSPLVSAPSIVRKGDDDEQSLASARGYKYNVRSRSRDRSSRASATGSPKHDELRLVGASSLALRPHRTASSRSRSPDHRQSESHRRNDDDRRDEDRRHASSRRYTGSDDRKSQEYHS